MILKIFSKTDYSMGGALAKEFALHFAGVRKLLRAQQRHSQFAACDETDGLALFVDDVAESVFALAQLAERGEAGLVGF